MRKLVIEDDEGKRTVVPLTRDDYTIGRQEGNTIRLTERNVSREHGRIKRKRPNGAGGAGAATAKDDFVLEDRSSYNGLFVNGLRVAHAQDLQHGDLIQIGDYRIVLQSDAASSIETAAIPVTQTDPGHDVKATIPMAAAFRGQDLTERPNRFVMLVGPTPGVEYPLDRERMTIGRAEDSSISVNHNSVSRLHCEVHALGDGRYEIVDKGSSNGVRVNAIELKRSIIEAGDVIELGDVRFKFVGAGQIFVPGPNESQQLTAISDRDAELASPRRKSWGGYALPIVGAGVVGALIILAFVYVLRTRANADLPPNGNITVPTDTDQAAVMEAKKSCTTDECELAYAQVSKLDERSPWRDSIDFRQIESLWAESMMKKARAEADPLQKRVILTRVSAAKTLDDSHKKQLAMELAALDQPPSTPSELPTAGRDPAAPRDPAVPTTAPISTKITPPVHPTQTTAARDPSAPPTTSAPPTATPKPPAQSVVDRARQAGLDQRYQEVRNLLEGRVRTGKAGPEEVRLVKEACRAMHDSACTEDIKQKYQ